MNDLYYPNEHALLSSWFGLPRPDGCQEIDLFDPPEGAEGIWPERSEYSDEDQALANAVSRIALGSIQNRLPQVGIFNREGELTLGRNYYPKPSRPVELLPQFLFMINWADTAPGLSWPESYHAAYLPGYDRYVVTASWDSTDMYGYTELAIGWFAGDTDVVTGARNAITGWWQDIANGSDQHRWEYVWEEGLVSKAEAESWADEVWGDDYDVKSALVSLQSDGAGEDEIGEALHALLMACIERPPYTAGKREAEEAFASSLDPEETPITRLLEIVQAAGQLGRDGRCLVPRLMALLDDPRVSDDDAIRAAIVDALDDIKPTDIAVHDRLVALLTDSSAQDGLRRACAQTLHTITGLEEYVTIRAMFPRGLSARMAPHDAPIYRGGWRWYEPNPTKAMRRAANRALSKMTRRPQSSAAE